MSEESVKELNDYLGSVRSMVDTSGNLYKGVDAVKSTKYSFFCVSYKPLDGATVEVSNNDTNSKGSSGM